MEILPIQDNFSQEWYQIFSNVSDKIICTIDLNKCFVTVNRSLSIVLGLPEEEISGKNYREVGLSESICLKLDNWIDTVIATNQNIDCFASAIMPDRNKHDYQIMIYPLHNQNGEVSQFGFICKDITAQKLTYEQLETAKNDFFTIIENAPDIITIHNGERILFINNKGVELIKAKSKFDLIGKPIWQFVHPDSTVIAKERIQAIENYVHELSAVEQKYICMDGSLLDVEVRSMSVTFNGKKAILIIVRDITERKKSQDLLKTERNLLKTVIDNIPDPIYVKDLTGRMVIANTSHLKFSGLKNENTDNSTNSGYRIKEGDITDSEQDDNYVLKEGKPIINKLEYYINELNDPNWLLTSKVPLFNEYKKVTALVSIGRNITESRKESLKKEEINEQLKVLIEAIPDPVFFKDASNRWTIINQASRDLFCIPEDYCCLGKTDAEMAVERPYYKNAHEYCTKTDTITWKNKHISYFDEVVISENDGKRYFYVAKVPLFEKNGTPKAIISIGRDITKNKEEEQRLKLLETVITNTTEGIIITNARKKENTPLEILYVNDAFLKMTGYTKEEIIGKNPKILQGLKTDRKELSKLNQAIRNNQTITSELINYTKNGKEFWSSINISPVFNSSEECINWIGIKRDITETKKKDIYVKKLMIHAQENEKSFIGRELHDNIAQCLVGSMLNLGIIKGKGENDKILLHEVRDTLKETLNEIRNLSHQLAPVTFEGLAFEIAIKQLLQQINKENRFSINTQFETAESMNSVSSEIQLNLYRIIQEQLQNILKHSEASHIDISIQIKFDKIKLRISDDGNGFDKRKIKKGIGLNNIKHRAQIFTGNFCINTAINQGCELIIEIPLG